MVVRETGNALPSRRGILLTGNRGKEVKLDAMREYWEGLVEHAGDGDVQDAREILEEFANSVEYVINLQRPDLAWSGPVPLPIAKYLGDAFRQILNGTDPAKALNLAGRSHGRHKCT